MDAVGTAGIDIALAVNLQAIRDPIALARDVSPHLAAGELGDLHIRRLIEANNTVRAMSSGSEPGPIGFFQCWVPDDA